jgi:predicted nucleic acid-binding Zn ribbon protein
MTYRDDDDEEEAELDERELPDAHDLDADPDGDVVPCPVCGKPLHEQADLCPRCGNFVSAEGAPRPRRPAWFIVGLVVSLLIALVWAIFG